MIMSEQKRTPRPGDADYKGGTFKTVIRVNGKAKEVTTIKDAYGNVVYVSERDLVLGIF